MKLGIMLKNITEAKGETLERLSCEFTQLISNHQERKLLEACLREAKRGRMFINFGRNIVPPETLMDEAFKLTDDGSMFLYRWG